MQEFEASVGYRVRPKWWNNKQSIINSVIAFSVWLLLYALFLTCVFQIFFQHSG